VQYASGAAFKFHRRKTYRLRYSRNTASLGCASARRNRKISGSATSATPIISLKSLAEGGVSLGLRDLPLLHLGRLQRDEPVGHDAEIGLRACGGDVERLLSRVRSTCPFSTYWLSFTATSATRPKTSAATISLPACT
jgi:hypothetical protein